MADLEVGRKLDGTDTDVARSIVFRRRGVVTHSREDERRFTVSPSVTTRIEMRGNSRDAPDSVVFGTSQESRDVDEQEPTPLVSHSFHAVQTHSPVPKRIEFKARREHVLVVGLGAVEGINREETDPCQEPLAPHTGPLGPHAQLARTRPTPVEYCEAIRSVILVSKRSSDENEDESSRDF